MHPRLICLPTCFAGPCSGSIHVRIWNVDMDTTGGDGNAESPYQQSYSLSSARPRKGCLSIGNKHLEEFNLKHILTLLCVP
ncbi:hypothetical protein L228DRAFT_23307 [Xylona heveae TC161]|uniref:Uncharacterized protein n=1 Tax=Xylona heveae (strain CBS 132557 / TC161) TaxID=1328760 RepID=A0A165A9X2_XYLHT|nr:hypothetical protein L228DRAFT_23307 [Xylona heveae TC161]KZF20147.1 hypothetical protein L228DRAFT_23307 [Xylona heveae TC161]